MGTLHRLLQTLTDSLAILRAGSAQRSPDDHAVERMALVIHEAMSQSQRSYHGVDHALAVAHTNDPIESLAGLFHDIVYLQIDRGLAPMTGELLQLEFVPGQWRIAKLLSAPKSAAEGRCLALFDVKSWLDLTPESGLNEALSALAATRLLEPVVPADALIGIQAAIEATIPFRGDLGIVHLRQRLQHLDARDGLGLGEAKIEAQVHAAARLANRDVQSFAAATTADFLASTWLLFTELDQTLRRGLSYSVRTYRKAVHSMERFLSTRADPQNIFVAASAADQAASGAYRQAARQNLSAAMIYMRVKLFPVAVIEALAECTGGDAPMEMFLGDPRDQESMAAWATRQLDARPRHLSTAQTHYEATVDAEIFQLLWVGRSGSNSFDLPNSPLGALLYNECGGPYLVDRYEQALQFFEGKITALQFLQLQDAAIVIPIAERVACIAPTRRYAMAGVLRTLRAAA